jgi:hypothetical protein
VAAAAGAAASRWRRLQGKAPAAVAAAGEGEAQRQQWKERRLWQKKGAAAPSGSRERSDGGSRRARSSQLLGFGGDSCFLGHDPTIPAQLYSINRN